MSITAIEKDNILLESAKESVTKYLTRINALSFNGDMEEHLYEFFDFKGGSTDAFFTYKNLCTSVLKFLAIPVNATPLMKALGEVYYSDFVNMIYRLHDFTSIMEMGNFSGNIVKFALENYAPSEFNLEHIKREYDGLYQSVVNYNGTPD